ncbi:MAG TPA: methylenetetrahydrofolate reductase [NAD(P)H] [Candidatus Paceibacterota bacterium]|nr:methylenetetrahydrofolate reductase [NAD(P)H] [Verrucomicrobiota bacterium]HOX02360.1 methylenetetrahydrofolate reductase [NAD(P)H] [Verrucomicrobiota bacterium]HRZ43701.1 methylenetetrahydrofolate reductase [NAD(P)H] [Candidatus Paceibacterota bacterium]HRZ92308.1 methylenetetrahydrofolate reductase [NAD(P)H] [Candidatus Paceibacterota bacterium]
MNIADLYRERRPVLSFEVFPPKPDTPLESLYATIENLRELNPSFISVTYGAGGAQKGRTVEIASRIRHDFGLESMAHLTCVGHSRSEIRRILEDLQARRIDNILALRGDPPQGQPDFDFSGGDFTRASELIHFIRQSHSFCIGAACYPEGHRACPRIAQDWRNLKTKVDAGVDFLITQLFFDNRIFYHFLESARGLGIACPIIPGIMPIFNARQIKRIVSLCGASMPADLLIMMDEYEDRPEDLRRAGIDYAVRQIRDLLDNGVEGIHLEPMNKPDLAREILAGVGWPIRPARPPGPAPEAAGRSPSD